MNMTGGLSVQYVTSKRRRGLISEATASQQRNILSRFVTTCGNRQPRQLSTRDVERWLEQRAHVSPGTRSVEFTVVRGFVRWLAQHGHTRADLMHDMTAPPVPRSVPRALSDDLVERLRAVLPDARARLIVELMVSTGLRSIEVSRLQLGDWDVNAGLLLVRGKGSHLRHVPVTTSVRAAIDVYIAEERSGSGGPLIASRIHPGRGVSSPAIGNMMRKWMIEAGIKSRPYDGRACHSLRHTCASRVADIEPDLRVLQDLLGHVRLSSTQIYLRRSTMAKVRAALERAEGHLPDAA